MLLHMAAQVVQTTDTRIRASQAHVRLRCSRTAGTTAVAFQELPGTTSHAFKCCHAAEGGNSSAGHTSMPHESRGDRQVNLADIGIGMMVSPTNSFLRAAFAASEQNHVGPADNEILSAAWHTWMRSTDSSLDVLLLVDCLRYCKDAAKIAGCDKANRTASLQRSRSIEAWDAHEVFPFTLPSWLTTSKGQAAPTLHFRCFWGQYSRRSFGSAKNAQKGAALFNALLYSMPTKRFYLKLDVDSLLLPHSLLRFLSELAEKLGDENPAVYFGTDRFIDGLSTWGYDIDIERRALVLSGTWNALSDVNLVNPESKRRTSSAAVATFKANMASASAKQKLLLAAGFAARRVPRQPKLFIRETPRWMELERQFLTEDQINRTTSITIKFAQGTAYGMSHKVLRAVVQSKCMARVHRVGNTCSPFQCRRKELVDIEDSLMGLCMHLHQVRLVTCSCFATDAKVASNTASISKLYVHQDASPKMAAFTRHRMCPAPISVHPLKNAAAFDRAWRDLNGTQWH